MTTRLFLVILITLKRCQKQENVTISHLPIAGLVLNIPFMEE